MKRRMIILCLCCVLLLSGCGWPDGNYHSVTPHREQSGSIRTENLVVSNYEELKAVMEAVVAKGTESTIINAVNYDTKMLTVDLANATRHIQKVYPIGAYAVEKLHYEVGSNTGKTAVALDIDYRRSRTEIRKIRSAEDAEGVRSLVEEALIRFDTELVVQMDNFQ